MALVPTTWSARRPFHIDDDDSSIASSPSALSTLDTREFDDVSIALADSQHQVGMPRPKRRRGRDNLELWSHALEDPPVGSPLRRNSKQEILYCARCKKGLSSGTAFRSHLKTKHGILVMTGKGKSDVERQATRLADGFKIQQTVWNKDRHTRQPLRNSVNEADWLTVLVLLVVNHNLPHTISQ